MRGEQDTQPNAPLVGTHHAKSLGQPAAAAAGGTIGRGEQGTNLGARGAPLLLAAPSPARLTLSLSMNRTEPLSSTNTFSACRSHWEVIRSQMAAI